MRQSIENRLTARLGILHPVLSAPMAYAAGGALAAAVSAAGGLGLIGGGYGDAAWLETQFAAAGNQAIGCGFITWSLAKQPHLLDIAIAHNPAALMLSFGEIAPFAAKIKNAGVVLICQVQNLSLAREAIEGGADVVVAQGGEAGGHGANRATFTLLPEIADLLAKSAPKTLLVAAGGIADGRGLAAALNLGADGVLMGSRFWASHEALVHPNHHAAAIKSSGDETLRQRSTDIARNLDWPAPFTARILQNEFTRRFAGREDELHAEIAAYGPQYAEASAIGDVEHAGVWVGEGTGLIHDIPTCAILMQRIINQAIEVLLKNAKSIVSSHERPSIGTSIDKNRNCTIISPP